LTLVIDASLALAWSFEDERTPPVLAVLEETIRDGAIVPLLWRLEIANSLRSALRRGRITQRFRDEALKDLADLRIEIDADTNAHAWSSIVLLSDGYDLTPYDAAYLELAQRRRVPIATLDGRMRRAALEIGIPVREVGN
jgi:predicted nucleic acid-binding protein